MKTLIITVGTRQVGWHCQDGVLRCLGADGDRGHPPHLEELYGEIELQRDYHEPGNNNSRWGVRHLGEQYYHLCQLQEDFSSVELLLDGNIIQDLVAEELGQVILWGTDQPSDVSWSFRRADTLWLAELMAGKIKQTWPMLEVDVWNPMVPANKSNLIRQEIEEFIFPYVLDYLQDNPDEPFTLAIANKGSAPAIATTLEICAAALVRECEVQMVAPEEPVPLYLEKGEYRTACAATEFQTVAIGDYFWPLERTRIISAWERGDFGEAKFLLKTHQSRYYAVYRLAEYLALASNWQVENALKQIQNGWLKSKTTCAMVEPDSINSWRERVNQILAKPETPEVKFLLTWESCFSIELLWYGDSYTAAFMQFAQTVERLLYIRCQGENWTAKGWVSADKSDNLFNLIEGWGKLRKLDSHSNWLNLLDQIRKKRNNIVHHASSLTPDQVRSLWTKCKFDITSDPHVMRSVLWEKMQEVLIEISNSAWPTSNQPLLKQLHGWGLQQLTGS